jgi:hypothetical protein
VCDQRQSYRVPGTGMSQAAKDSRGIEPWIQPPRRRRASRSRRTQPGTIQAKVAKESIRQESPFAHMCSTTPHPRCLRWPLIIILACVGARPLNRPQVAELGNRCQSAGELSSPTGSAPSGCAAQSGDGRNAKLAVPRPSRHRRRNRQADQPQFQHRLPRGVRKVIAAHRLV